MRIFYALFLATIVLLPVQFALNPTPSIDLPVLRPLAIILLLGTLFMMLYKRKTIPFSFPLLALSLFLVTVLTSLLWHDMDAWGTRKTLFLFSIAPLFLVTVFFCINKSKGHTTVMRAIVYGAAGIALVGIIQFSLQFIIGLDPALNLWRTVSGVFLGHNLGAAVATHSSWLVHVGGADLFRLTAFFPDPHISALYLGMSAPLALGLYMQSKQRFWLVFTTVIIVADLLTFSRGGYVALFGGAFCFLFFMRHSFTAGTKILFYVFTATIILTFAIPNPVSQRFMSSFNLTEGSNTQRLHNWQQANDIIESEPMWGVGIGQYSRAVLPSATYRDPIYAHNLYLDIMAELGATGLIAWLLFVGSVLVVFLTKHSFYGIAGATSISIFSIHSFFETALFSVHIFALLVIIAGLSAYSLGDASSGERRDR